MPMPETAVNKYGNFLTRQDDVRASGQFRTIPFLAITKGVNDSIDDSFGPCVPRFYAAHDTAALGGGKGVHVPRSVDHLRGKNNLGMLTDRKKLSASCFAKQKKLASAQATTKSYREGAH